MNHQCSNADADAKADKRGSDNRAGRRRRIDYRGIVLGYINHLWIGRLDHIDGLRTLLDNNCLLWRGLQRPRRIGLCAQPLDSFRNTCLVCRHGLTDGGIVIDIFGHHLQHARKLHQRNKCRIKSLLLRRLAELIAAQSRIVGEPVIHVQDLLR